MPQSLQGNAVNQIIKHIISVGIPITIFCLPFYFVKFYMVGGACIFIIIACANKVKVKGGEI